MFDKVKKIVDEWDPIDLLSMHCPDDEYDDISLLITQKALVTMDVENLANYIYVLFVYEFDASTFNKTLDEFRMIAEKIIEKKR